VSGDRMSQCWKDAVRECATPLVDDITPLT
jgi:hypothetical protein